MPKSEHFLYFPRQDILSRCFHFGVCDFIFQFDILGNWWFYFTKIWWCKVTNYKGCLSSGPARAVFSSFGRKPLAIMLFYIGDGIRDSFKK